MTLTIHYLSVSLFALLVAAPTTAAPPPNAASLEFFEMKIRPVLVNNCYTCHSADTNSKGGLRVDDRNGLLQGGDSGPSVVPGDPEKSLLLQAVRYSDEIQMPPAKQLSAEEIADLTKWIKDGAHWPPAQGAVKLGERNPQYEALRNEHWAWQPIASPKAPAVKDVSWAHDDIDRFILAKLEEKGLQPVADARKGNLLRRVSFDLTGLPPTPEETEAFEQDRSPDALEKVVDRLLASPAFGERWGRHWLDIARYGESTGPSRNIPYPHAWRYRDYVIDAFNKDKPYDQFIREQIAGDLLPAKSEQQREEQLVATGFLALGGKDVNQRFKVRFIMDNVDEQIDTVSRSVLALTVSCARCHDHKFDPIPTADYYALAGIFRSSDLLAGVRNKMGGGGLDYYDSQMLAFLDPTAAPKPENEEKIKQAKANLATARAELVALRDKPNKNAPGTAGDRNLAKARKKVQQIQARIVALSDPAANGRVAMGVRDSKNIADTEIRIRGEAEKLGPIVPRGFLSVVQYPGQPSVDASQSGRLQLAQWLTSEKNPLASRVMANRIWQRLFDQGLVSSVDNFGVTGDVPSHPELLDHLAVRFVEQGWSVKKLVKAVVLSRAYQLSSEATPAQLAVDPANRLVWRHTPRRLAAEEIRDATLVAAGTLDRRRPVASPARDLQVIELPNNGPIARRIDDHAQASVHRSVYLPLLRDLTPRSLAVFDFAEQGFVTGSRDVTTVAPQALYLLNDPFVRRQSLLLAQRLLYRGELEESARVDAAYRLTLGRSATSAEIVRATGYLSDYESAARKFIPPKTVVAKAEVPAIAPAPASDAESEAKDAQNTATPRNGRGKAGSSKKAVEQALDPDAVVAVEDPVEEAVEPTSSREAAWASFCQALFGSAEFRYLK